MHQTKPKPVQKRISINVGKFDGDTKAKVPLRVPQPKVPPLVQHELDQHAAPPLDAGLLDKLSADLGGVDNGLAQSASILNTNMPRTRSVTRILSGMTQQKSVDWLAAQPSVTGKFNQSQLPASKSIGPGPQATPAQKLPSIFDMKHLDKLPSGASDARSA